MKKLLVCFSAMFLLFSLCLCASAIDISNITEVYRNTFDDNTALSDFRQANSIWKVFGGRLYMRSASDSSGLLLYNNDDELYNLTDYVLEVDILGTQTQAGAIVRSNHKSVNYIDSDSFAGYFCFISYDGKKGAIGLGNSDGTWGGNLKVSEDILTPCSNIHLTVAVKGNQIEYTIKDMIFGYKLWQHTETNNVWKKGTFGLRMTKKVQGELGNLLTTSFDNLVVSKFNEDMNTEIKMSVGRTVAYVNGNRVSLDTVPVIRESRTMLPVRFVAENLHASVEWDGTTSTVTVKTSEKEIKIPIGSNVATVNGESVTLDSPAFIENSRTYLPVRFIAESLGATVSWDGATSTATITSVYNAQKSQTEEKPEHCAFYVEGVSAEEMAEYFCEVCISSEAEPSNDPYIKKWLGPIFYTYSGYYYDENLEVIREFIAELNEIEGFPGIYPVERGITENMTMNFCSYEEIGKLANVKSGYIINGLARCYRTPQTRRLTKAEISYAYDMVPTHIKSTLVEEIYNAIGGGCDTGLRSNSIIYEYYTNTYKMTDIDKAIIQILYSPHIKCGMSKAQCESAIIKNYY